MTFFVYHKSLGNRTVDKKEAQDYVFNVFSFNTTPLKWDAARLACLNTGGDLASVSSKAEQDEIMSHATVVKEGDAKEWWIGLKEEGQDIWKWSDISNR